MTWTEVIALDELPVDRGVAALVDGRAIALFRLTDDALYAIDHVEPFTNVPVLARGLVGSSDGNPTVASPLHKQRFDLRTGRCLDADATVATFPVRVDDGTVLIDPNPPTATLTLTPPEGTTMTPTQIDLVTSTFAEVEPIADTAAELFYGRLFEIAPDTKDLFTGDMIAQGRALMSTIGVVVRSLHDLDAVLPTAAKLAVRHVDYGVTADHYPTVGAALLWTLERGLGEQFTTDVAEAWTIAYTTLSEAMIEAAYGSSADSQLAS